MWQFLNGKKKKKRIFSEAEIFTYSMHDQYKREKLFKDSLCYVVSVILIAIGLLIITSLFFNEDFRRNIINQIVNNIGVIIVCSTSILGISITQKPTKMYRKNIISNSF